MPVKQPYSEHSVPNSISSPARQEELVASVQAGVPTQALVERSLSFVSDVALGVSVQFGGATITLERLLQLAVGSVIELESRPGEPLHITVQGKTVAHGEVVVVNEHYGVRLTEVL